MCRTLRFRNSVIVIAFLLCAAPFSAGSSKEPTCEDRFSGPVSVTMCHLGEGFFLVFQEFLNIFLVIVGGGTGLWVNLNVLIPLNILASCWLHWGCERTQQSFRFG